MKVIAIIQARMGSTRMPKKVMKELNGMPMIELLLKRLSKSKEINQIIIATSINNNNNVLKDYVRKIGYKCEEGSENDVLDRYYNVAIKYDAEAIVRITGDCPLIDHDLVDLCIQTFKKENCDYLSNTIPPTYPDGLDVEVFTIESLKRAHSEAHLLYDREHVTPYIKESGKFKCLVIKNKLDLSNLRWTVDEPEDFEVINNVIEYFKPDIYMSWEKIYNLHMIKPELFEKNIATKRDEGAKMLTGQKLWKRAKRVIPGGNMLLSKRSEMFLPEKWPAYFSKAKGCVVWDMDGNRYIDMSIMGIGTNTLGYGHPEIDNAVIETVKSGNMSTLNCPEEVFLAEKLVEIHPWADMVRLARSGGEANAIAVRIARAATGKEKIAICGYHGWHDWYLSANLSDDNNLDGHLLPGLEPKGVPRNLKGTVLPFEYNNYEQLQKILNENDIGVIKMEVVRNLEPNDNFLKKVRDLATKKGIVLIFDECTSGFRETYGGLHKKYNVEPDMAMFGKALGNGYAITAIIGKKEVMEAAQSTFISSTFWTERIGPSAALKTLEIMKEMRSWEIITETGKNIKNGWKKLAKKYDLILNYSGISALCGFTIKSNYALEYKTLITQEMLKKGYLASNSVYACTEHSNTIVNEYLDALDPIFKIIAECTYEGRNILDILEGPVCHSGFKRLN
jgi:glutamate-1-semialdehyde 2,1-aminomutase